MKLMTLIPKLPPQASSLLRFLRRPRWQRITAGALVLVLLAWWAWPSKARSGKQSKQSKQAAWSAEQSGPLTGAVISGPFVQEVVERGEVESSSNVEIRCEVQSRLIAGTPIIELVAEGTYVSPGDFLVKLDDSGLQADLVQQQIACNTSRSLAVEAESDNEAAKLALEEYEMGTFLQEERTLEGEQFVGRENLRRAEEYLRYSQKLAQRGYVTDVQLEADRFAVEKARKDLDTAESKLDILRKFTRVKMVNRLKAAVETSDARLKARQNSHNLDEERRKSLEDQLAKCVIKAPTSGQVVHANLPSGDPLIMEGKPVRERQLIIRLPDPKRMQVLARINESRIDRVKVGMRTTIRLDAFPAQELSGQVRSVSEYPLPASSVYSTTKEYAAEIEIEDPPTGVRTGMTAKVAVEVDHRENVTQVPLQAVLERGEKYFCLVSRDGELKPQEVTVAASNDQHAVVEKGLQPGDLVVLAPQAHEHEVDLPAIAPKAKKVARAPKPGGAPNSKGAAPQQKVARGTATGPIKPAVAAKPVDKVLPVSAAQ